MRGLIKLHVSHRYLVGGGAVDGKICYRSLVFPVVVGKRTKIARTRVTPSGDSQGRHEKAVEHWKKGLRNERLGLILSWGIE